MSDRQSFTTRLDPDLVVALDESRLGTQRSRNWVIEQAVRAWLNNGAREPVGDDPPAPSGTPAGETEGPPGRPRPRGGAPGDGAAADETPAAGEAGVHKTRAHARAASAGTVQGAQPPRPRHFHRFTVEQPGTRRGVAGQTFATFACDGCDREVERAVR